MRSHGITDVNSLAKDSLQISIDEFIKDKPRGNELWTKLDKPLDKIITDTVVYDFGSIKTTDQEFSDLNKSLRKQAGLE